MNRSGIFFKSKTIGPRLRYVVSELFERRMGLTVTFCPGDMTLPEDGFSIGYGFSGGNMFFPTSGILEESGELNFSLIPSLNLNDSSLIHSNGNATKGDFPGMAFWLLSRYEEHQNPSFADQHGRFPSDENSLVKHCLHAIPIIERWASDLSLIMQAAGLQVQLLTPRRSFSFDLDNPTAFLYKSPVRQMLAAGRDLLNGNPGQIITRFRVLAGFRKDPYDNMVQIGDIVTKNNLAPDLFVWIGDYGPHDKGLSHTSEFFRKSVAKLRQHFSIGLHPSYASFGNIERLKKEKSRLEELTGSEIKKNRFHFLRFRLQEGYRILLALGFQEDHSMGFSDRMGYRAGTGQPFYWYDLQAEESTALLIFPFSMMDSTAHFHLKISAEEFISVQKQQFGTAEFNGSFHAVFHNEHPSWSGWEQMISRFIKES
ncbi:MAG TPA: hypothetical protein PLK63_10245 [Catalimonadaceae bacterium]|nr:hypothetical protein [Catalimonadaceae bacterium]